MFLEISIKYVLPFHSPQYPVSNAKRHAFLIYNQIVKKYDLLLNIFLVFYLFAQVENVRTQLLMSTCNKKLHFVLNYIRKQISSF